MITFLGDIALINDNIRSEYIPKGDYIASFEYVCHDGSIKPVEGKINLSHLITISPRFLVMSRLLCA